MGYVDQREWIERLERQGQLKRIKAKVNWDEEIAGIISKVFSQKGPALLFENIEGHEKTWCKRLFAGGLATRQRLALMMNLDIGTPYIGLVKELRKRLRNPISPVDVTSGPIKETILRGEKIDLMEIPVPKWHPRDGGRYINTWCGVVTMDPETGEHNVGMYRGMILTKSKIGVFLVPAQGWGTHFTKYQSMGEPMPVAIAYGWDPCFDFIAGTPLTSIGEYQAMGAIRGEPVPLVRCETSDIKVPASAEIVIEGTISADPNNYEIEGPFGEWTGYYSMIGKRPCIQVECITFRDEPVFRGTQVGLKAGISSESAMVGSVGYSALILDILEAQGIPGIIDVTPFPWIIIKLHKTYQGQARHVAAALWGSRLSVNICKTIVVVEEDVDIRNIQSVLVAITNNVDPKKDIVIFPLQMGSAIDVGLSARGRDELAYGAGLQDKFLIDATIDWETHPPRKEWDNRRLPPVCSEIRLEVEELVNRRWREYGF